MSKLLQAAEAVRGAIRQYTQLSEYADVLERVGALENAEAETQARLTALRAEEVEADKQTKAAKAQARKEQTKADTLMSRTVAECDRITAVARDEAAAIVANAKAKAKKTDETAATKAAERLALAEQKRTDLQAAMDSMQEQLDGLILQCDERAKQLADINTSIELAKAKVAGLFNS